MNSLMGSLVCESRTRVLDQLAELASPGFDVIGGEQAIYRSHKVGTCCNHCFRILKRKPTYGGNGSAKLARLAEDLQRRRWGLLLGFRGKEAPERQVTATCGGGLLGQCHRTMAGGAEYFVRPQSLTGSGKIAIGLTQMNPVGVNCQGQSQIVVNDQQPVIGMAKPE